MVLASGAAEIGDDFARDAPNLVTPWNEGTAQNSDEAVMVSANWEELRALMWNFVGIVRSDKRLERGRRRIELLREEIAEYYWKFRVTRDVLELRNIALVGHLILECARMRKETRGLHYNIDYPETMPEFARNTLVDKRSGPRASDHKTNA